MTELDGKSPLTAVEKPVDSTADAATETPSSTSEGSAGQNIEGESKTSTDVTPSDTVRFLTIVTGKQIGRAHV